MQHSADLSEPDPNAIKWLKDNCVPIVGLVFGALVLCLVAHYGSTIVDWTRTKDFAEAFASVTQSLALNRLTPTVNGKLISIDGAVFLSVTIQLENVGLSRIAFDQTASALYVFEHVVSEVDEILRVKNNKSTLFRIFDDKDRYIEPNEVSERQTLAAADF